MPQRDKGLWETEMLVLKGLSTNLLQAPVQRQQLEKHLDHKEEEFSWLTLGYVLKKQELGESSQGTEVLASPIVQLSSPPAGLDGQVQNMALFINLASSWDITPLNLFA